MKHMLAVGLILSLLLAPFAPLAVFANEEFDCANVTEIPQLECEALVAFYNSTSGPGWYDNTNWLVTNTPNDWIGVGVDGGHVTYLGISENQLSGVIPPELGNLSCLQTIYLDTNQLSGSIPSEIGNLINLHFLSLDNNQLSGSIPFEIGNLIQLTNLELSDNQLSGDIPVSFVNLLLNVDDLSLDYNMLNVPAGYPDPNNPLHVFLSQKDPDWHLNQYHYFTTCAAVSQIPQVECEALQALYNNTNGPEWTNNTHWWETDTPGHWYGVIVYSGHVTALYLQRNQLSGFIPEELGYLSNLAGLFLYDNQLSGFIPPELGIINSLHYMILYGNQLWGAIPPALGNLSSLYDLNLSSNQLSGSIPPELGNMNALVFLNLSSNKLSGPIPSELGNLWDNSIEIVIDLSDNQLSGAIPPELEGAGGVTVQRSSSNQLNAPTYYHFLDLSNNHLSGSIPDSLIGLDYLDLDYNALNVPEGYPDPADPLQVYLSYIDPEWHTLQAFTQTIGSAGGTLTSLDGRTEFVISSGTLDGDTTFTFTPQPIPKYSLARLSFAHNSFQLSAVDADDNPLTVFNLPVTATLSYTDADFLIAPEDTLGLYWWDSDANGWLDALSTCSEGAYTRDLDANTFSLPICHLSEFAVLGQPLQFFIPFVQVQR